MMLKRKRVIQQVIVLLAFFPTLCSWPAVSGSLKGAAETIIDERLQTNNLSKTTGLTPPTLITNKPGSSKAKVIINSINGWNAGDLVINGRWTGQPPFSEPPKSDAYKDMLAIESQSSSAIFTITGKNFGTQKGRVDFLGTDLQPISYINITIESWSDTKIKIIAQGLYTFTSISPGYVRVLREDVYQPPMSVSQPPMSVSQPPISPMSYEGAGLFEVRGFVGVIQTRGYGQCTWYVAKRLLDVGKSIPHPSAYSTTGSITSSYVPQLWDGLRYADKHVAIITSNPDMAKASDGTISYSFSVGEMNALSDENIRESTQTFAVNADQIVTSIGSISSYKADSYWRDNDIRDVDFLNFTYNPTWCNQGLGTSSFGEVVRIVNGEFKNSDLYYGVVDNRIIYGDLTSDHNLEAIVHNGCGFITANYGLSEIFVYAMKNGRPALLAHLNDKDMEHYYVSNYPGGILWRITDNGVKVEDGDLVVERFAEGAHCCPKYITTFKYRWDGTSLVQVGGIERRNFVDQKTNITSTYSLDDTTIKSKIINRLKDYVPVDLIGNYIGGINGVVEEIEILQKSYEKEQLNDIGKAFLGEPKNYWGVVVRVKGEGQVGSNSMVAGMLSGDPDSKRKFNAITKYRFYEAEDGSWTLYGPEDSRVMLQTGRPN